MVQLDSVGAMLLRATSELLAAEGPGALTVWATCHGVVSLELRAEHPIGINWPIYPRATTMIVRGLA